MASGRDDPIDRHREIEAVYRKIHLFDVDLRGRGGGAFRESDTIAPGGECAAALSCRYRRAA